MRGKGTKLGEGKESKLGEPCPKVRLSQDRLPIEPFPSKISYGRGKGTTLCEGEKGVSWVSPAQMLG